jgi:excisionase family DNA binding protein
MSMKLYSIAELTEVLHLHPKTILRFIHEGKIVASKVGRSWRVSQEDLKAYCHAELADQKKPSQPVNYGTLADRISVSAVIEIKEQNSEEATRLSNLVLAMLNSERAANAGNRFDFFYYPEIEKAKYIFQGSPDFIRRIIDSFAAISGSQGDKHD